jgi:hypothetical protein
VIRLNYIERGYEVKSIETITVGQTAVNYSLKGTLDTIYIHNTSVNTVYFDVNDAVDTTGFEIGGGKVMGGFYNTDLYFISTSGTNTLKIMRVGIE